MVVGKNTPQAVKRATTTRLPPLRVLRVRRPDTHKDNPCMNVMISVLGCWASQGYTTQGCAAVEQSLRECMDARKPDQGGKSKINTYLAKFYPRMREPQKRK